jgi:hypothetical protein
MNDLLLTPSSRIFLEMLIGSQLVKKFPAVYETWRFITAFTNAGHLSVSWTRSIKSAPSHPTSLRSILILSFYLSLGLPCVLFPSGFPTKILYKSLLSSIRATCPDNRIHIDWIARKILGEEYTSLSSSLCSFLHSPVPLSLLDPNMLLSTLVSNTLSLRTFLNVSDKFHIHTKQL